MDNLIGQGSMGMANRDKIWAAAVTQIAQRPILGFGNGASMYAIEAVYRFYGTHNSYILVLLEFGIIGSCIVFLWQSRVFMMCSKCQSKVYKILFYSMLAALVLVFILSTVLSLRFTKPLNLMKEIAMRLADKDYKARCNIKQNDEIGELANTLDILSERLQLADEESQKLEKLRRAFIANISHELRTPVTVIRGSLEALRDGVITEAE
jgi:signal transduction histidine kinase